MLMHRDRRSDDVRAAKCDRSPCPPDIAEDCRGQSSPVHGPPLCGRPEKAAAGVDRLGRATGPPFGSLLLSRLPRPITATSSQESAPSPSQTMFDNGQSISVPVRKRTRRGLPSTKMILQKMAQIRHFRHLARLMLDKRHRGYP